MKMMMLKEFTAVLLGLSLFSTVLEANTGESFQLKLYNRDFHASPSEIQEMLKKADLEGHGYKKEVVTKRVKKPDKPEYQQKSLSYYKIGNCSKVPEIEEELNKLLSGPFGSELADKLTKEMKVRHLVEKEQCQTGVEIVFNYGNKKANLQRKKRGWRVRIRIRIGIDVKKKQKVNHMVAQKKAEEHFTMSLIKSAVKKLCFTF